MPLICYKPNRFHDKSRRLIAIANQICTEYMAKGYTLTLRQLYYQFVARGHIPNTMKDYKNLGNLINDARLAGMLDWNAIEDRTRNLESLPNWASTKEILESAATSFKYDYWDSQPVYIEIWVEKEALIGVVEQTAHKYRLPHFACRGYTSQSEAWRAGMRFCRTNYCGQPVKILHLGDHDPSGIDMTRDNDERLTMFSENGDVEIIRLALNMDQIEQYNPPPNPAKWEDKRYAGYAAIYGDSCWELDALDPEIIDGIISIEMEKYIDWNAWKKIQEKEQRTRDKLMVLAKNGV